MAEHDELLSDFPPAPEPGPAGKTLQRVELRWLHYLYEFLIVALGISVPFLLDRWNQHFQDRRAERQIYQNLLRELEEDLDNLQSISRQNLAMLDQFRFGNQIIQDADRRQIDTLTHISRNMSNISDFHRSSTVYQTLINSGEMQLMHNRKILRDLQDLEEQFLYMNRLEDNHLSIFIDQILPELAQHMQLEPPDPLDPDWFYSFRLRNLLQLSIYLCMEKQGIYGRIEQILLELLNLLQAELNGH